ncbi:MAG TPA: hypothetical protein DDZ34_02140 [Syntrophaceae bacterium]|nr:hypothetical protein [Syntrophaceae bacterium]
MLFESLDVERIAVHEIFQRDINGYVEPALGKELINLSDEAKQVFCQRVADAMSSPTRCVEMNVMNSGEGSVFDLTRQLLAAADDEEFVAISRGAGAGLAQAQDSMRMPGGLLMVFNGTAGVPRKRYIGYLKAEPLEGFRQSVKEGKTFLEFIKKLFLTPDSKVYKVGLFVEMDQDLAQSAQPQDGFGFYLFDANIISKETVHAATYFYQSFLGLMTTSSDAKNTRRFIDVTRSFIDKMDVDPEVKLDLRSALNTYLKTDQAQTASIREFADRYFDDDTIRDDYQKFATKNRLPDQAFTKDLSESRSVLKTRRIRFAKDVQLSAPVDEFSRLISIKKIQGEGDASWTEIIVKSRLIGE